MKKLGMNWIQHGLCLALSLIMFTASGVRANNVQVSTVTLTGQNAASQYTNIQFNLSWENSWRDAAAPSPTDNWDAVWVFAKVSDAPGLWKHATLSTNAADHNGQGFTVTPSPDGKGVFIHRAAGGQGNVSLTNVLLRWNYGSDVITSGANVTVRVFAVEMVYVPQGAFFVGDGTTTALQGQFIQGGTTNPFQITSEAALTLGGTAATNLASQTGSYNDDFTSAVTKTLPDAYPKGFNAFYCMKYEVSQQQYADFRNTLTLTQSNANNTGTSGGRPNPTLTGTHPNLVAPRPDRAIYINSTGARPYMDWAALRPMSELEYEKACRGPLAAVPDEYPWGDITIQQVGTLSGNEDGTETVTTLGANCNFNNNAYTNGDGGSAGGLRVGIFAKAGTGRSNAGATYYGIMDMGGSWNEPVVPLDNANSRAFNGTHGDGNLTAAGDDDVATWTSAGFYFRGGFCGSTQSLIRTSSRGGQSGFNTPRCVRTAP